MSKKNKNVNTVDTNEVVENNEVEAVEEVAEVVAEEPAKEEVKEVEEAQEPSNSDEIKATEDVVEEVKETVVEPAPVPVEEVPAPTVDNLKVVSDDEVIDYPADFFIQINKEPFTDEKLSMVIDRLGKYRLDYHVTAEGLVLVGPYVTKDGAINGRRLVIRCGLKGDIVEIPKD
jgi:hypothetical protein